MEKYITPQKKYYTLDYYLKETYKSKVFKVALNGDFTCPNRDGTISHLGCFYCSESGSGDFAGKKEDTLAMQFQSVKEMLHQKWKDAKYIAYFQANTNTYAPLEKLQDLFFTAISLDPDIVALSIATRPDCLNPEVLDLLSSLQEKTDVWVELGLQSIHTNTQTALNLGYTTQDFIASVQALSARGIKVIAHIINGLPGETDEMMYETLELLNTLPIFGLKIHSLYIQQNTILARIYEKNPFKLLTLEEYTQIVVTQIKRLRPDIVLHRINGDAPGSELIAPMWTKKKLVIMNEIDKMLNHNNWYQGMDY